MLDSSILSSHPSESLGLSDEAVIARIRNGEHWCFEILMRRHNRRVFRATRAILRRDDEAEDVMQEAYVRAFEHLADFRGDASFATWITRIAIHEALARKRREQRFGSLDTAPQTSTLMPAESPRNPEQEVNDQQLRAVLERAIDALPDDFRAVFVLRAVEQMSGAEAAACLDIPEETVKTRLHRARLRLQEVVVHALDESSPRAYEFHLSRCDRVVKGVLERLGISHEAALRDFS
ncbi:MAG TPA: RNA polymerase sigma factor [Polyangiaceae bacterium]|nr:RNA polymerase sigma factor [Polyangiaceae bacterium]